MKKTKTANDIKKEIKKFIKDKPGITYYEVKAYAYDNDMEEWLEAMNDPETDQDLDVMVRLAVRKAGVPYRVKPWEAAEQLEKAEEMYQYRHEAKRQRAKRILRLV